METKYYFSTKINDKDLEEVVDRVKDGLQAEGFGIISDIDLSGTLKKRLNVDFKKYRILGACNPHFAYKALLSEDKIGLFLPCNVVIEELEPGIVEVSAVDPVASMMSVQNEKLEPLAVEVQRKLQNFINIL